VISRLTSLFTRNSEPVIGYKQAYLRPDGFGGITGKKYSVDAEAVGPGFHAFYRFEDAWAHEQKGSAILEVLLSGTIKCHQLGVTASHQRVLQVMPTKCWACGELPERFTVGERMIWLLCPTHAEQDDSLAAACARFDIPNTGVSKPIAELDDLDSFRGVKFGRLLDFKPTMSGE